MEDTVATTPEDIAPNPFTEENSLSDLILQVEGRKLYVHKMVLAVASPVFKAMFFPTNTGSAFREKDAREMPLPDKKYEDVVDFLIQIYAEHSHQPITEDSLVGVMSLADEYQVNYVMDKCQRYVEAQLTDQSKLSAAHLLMYLWICKRYQHRLQQSIDTAMVGVLERPIHDIQKCEYYSQLTREEQNNVIFERCQRLEKEHTLVRFFVDNIISTFNSQMEHCTCNRVVHSGLYFGSPDTNRVVHGGFSFGSPDTNRVVHSGLYFGSPDTNANRLYATFADGWTIYMDKKTSICSNCISEFAKHILMCPSVLKDK